MIADLEAANEERSKINQKYAEQYRRVGGSSSSAYESAVKLPGHKKSIIGTGLRNYPSARALSNNSGAGRNLASIESSKSSNIRLSRAAYGNSEPNDDR